MFANSSFAKRRARVGTPHAKWAPASSRKTRTCGGAEELSLTRQRKSIDIGVMKPIVERQIELLLYEFEGRCNDSSRA